MGLFKKDPLNVIFEDYDRGDCAELLDIARAVSRNDPEVVKAVEFALGEPQKYLKQNAERFNGRGIELDNEEILDELDAGDLLFLAMVDELEAHGYSVEIDFTCGYGDFLAALKTLKTYDMIADVMPTIDMGEIAEDGDVDVWIEEINGVLDGKAFICCNDNDSDSYSLMIVDPETFELLNGGNDEARPAERNEIDNHDLKIRLADTALGLLVQGEDFGELANTQCEFGYLFDIEGHGIEALFKITTDKTTAYFAAQVDKLIRLNFNDELFKTTVEGFLEMHGGNDEP